MEGVQVFDNKVRWPFSADRAEMTLGHLTVAGNYWVNSLGNTLDANGARTSGSFQPAINIFSSIWADHVAFDVAAGSIRADCLMAETNDGLTSHSRSQFGVTDPGFVDKDNGDLHLRTDSPALDYCDNVNFNSIDADYDIDARGIDLPTVANLHGPFDLGADEATMGPPPPPSGPIFSDGFESPP